MSSILSFLLACRSEATEDTAAQIETRPEEDIVVQETDTDAELQDIDEDGYLEDVDCDDWNPNIYPGAPEQLNDKDDDCDGYVDADGVHSGSLTLDATAVYQGQTYTFEQNCTGSIERVVGQVVMELSCAIDQSQERADQLLGETLVVRSQANFVFENEGSSNAEFVSTGGETEWDSSGTASWVWSTWESNQSADVDVQVRLDALHLDIWLTGTFQKE